MAHIIFLALRIVHIADILVLLSATLPGIPEPFFERQRWPWGRAMCSILIFLQYLGVDASSLSITAFTMLTV
jgi:thyrotropin-releasing hormone receptor